MRNHRTFLPILILVACLAGAVGIHAQTTQPEAEPAPAGASQGESQAVIQERLKSEELVLSGKGGYNYEPAGRRDPFVNPLAASQEEEKKQARPPGWPGMLIGEVSLQGITVYGGEPIAIFNGTDGVGYFAREGDELWDGKIVGVDFDNGVVTFQQKVEDPSSPVRFRNVEKKLNP